MRGGELKRYSGSCKARRIDQIKAGPSNVIHGKYIYTKMWPILSDSYKRLSLAIDQ